MTDRGPPDEGLGDVSSEDVTLGLEGSSASVVPEAPVISGYRTIRLLGEGGMGRVFLAQDEFLDRPVAIKLISEALPREAEPVARFQREARAMAAIEHPNIVHIYSYGIAEGRPYFVMQFIEGEDLSERMRRLGQGSLNDAVHFALQILDALEAAWKSEIVHRDLKPANVLIDTNNDAHVADFGLAMAMRSTIDPSHDERGRFLGTPRYIAPEQALGEDVDFRADLYSLGLMLYEMLAGEAPFDALTPMRMMSKRLEEPIPSVRLKRPDLPIEADRIVTWLTTFDRDLRPGSHESVRTQLRALQSARPSSAVYEVPRRDTVRSKVIPEVSQAPRPQGLGGPDQAKPVLEESKQATVVRAEIVGHGSRRENQELKESACATPHVLQQVREAIEQRGGSLEVDRGTATATFGFPTAFEGSPVAAVNAAIALREAIRAENQTSVSATPVLVRVGIETGRVTGTSNKLKFQTDLSLGGEAVHTAAALCAAAREGQILLGRNVRRLTQGLFVSGELRGIRDPDTGTEVDASELVSNRETERRVDLGERRIVSSRLIGRENELDRLGLHVLELLSGRGAIVSIVGPAGIGKTRLLSELKRTYSDKNVVILEGRSVSTGGAMSFHPLIDILKKWTRISDDDSNADALHKLETAIGTVLPSETAEVMPFIATVMGLKLSGAHADRMVGIEGHNFRQLIFKGIRSLLVAASTARPLVLVFEDLHWADQTSLEFLESLYGLAMNHQILFVNLFRPGYEESTGRLAAVLEGSFGPFHEEILLQPLDPADCEHILIDLFHTCDLPTAIKQPIIQRSDGNPFFLEEIVQSLLDEGKVLVVRGEIKETEKIESLDVPETVQDVLQARLDRLDAQDRHVVRIASVVGRIFLYSVLTDVARNVDHLDDRLLYLEHLGMIRRREHLGQLAFTFRHALMQDVAYSSILAHDRRALHLETARSIEKRFSNRETEFYGMLAYHYCAAEHLEKSEEYLIKAGREAQQVAGSSEALRYFQRALALYSDRRDTVVTSKAIANLESNVALALYNHGSYGESIKCFRKVLPSFGITPPGEGIGLASRFLVSFVDFVVTVHMPAVRFRRHPTPADSKGIQLYYKQLAGLAHHDPKRFFLESFVLAKRLAVFDLGEVDNGVGMFASAGNLLSWTGISFYLSARVLRLLEDKIDHTDPKALISYGAAKITHEFLAGDWGKTSYDEELVRRALALGETFLTANYVIFHGRMALEQGRFDVACGLADKLDEIGVEYDHSYPPALHVYLHAKTLLKRRRLPEAVTECDSGRRAAEKAALETVVYGLGALKSRALAYMGDTDAADEVLQRVAESGKGTRLPKSYLGDFLISRCTIDVMRLDRGVITGDDERIGRLIKQAELSAARLLKNSAKVASHQVEANRLSGLVHWLAGRHRKAVNRWQRGIQIGERLGADLDLARLYKEVGVRLQAAVPRPGGLTPQSPQEYLEQAHSKFQCMGLEWDLMELGGALEGETRR